MFEDLIVLLVLIVIFVGLPWALVLAFGKRRKNRYPQHRRRHDDSTAWGPDNMGNVYKGIENERDNARLNDD